MTRTLTNRTDAFDLAALFNLEISDRRGTRNIVCYARKIEGEAFINKNPAMICATYTQAQIDATDRLATEAPVRDGDLVTLEGTTYRVKVNGNYLDAAQLIEVRA